MTYGELYNEFSRICPIDIVDYRPYDELDSLCLFLENNKALKVIKRHDSSWIVKESSADEWSSIMFPGVNKENIDSARKELKNIIDDSKSYF